MPYNFMVNRKRNQKLLGNAGNGTYKAYEKEKEIDVER